MEHGLERLSHIKCFNVRTCIDSKAIKLKTPFSLKTKKKKKKKGAKKNGVINWRIFILAIISFRDRVFFLSTHPLALYAPHKKIDDLFSISFISKECALMNTKHFSCAVPFPWKFSRSKRKLSWKKHGRAHSTAQHNTAQHKLNWYRLQSFMTPFVTDVYTTKITRRSKNDRGNS